MVGPRGVLPWFLRAAFLFGLLAALWVVAPTPAFARPYNIDPGPIESGDPTADEHPSPTPKPKAAAVQIPSAIQGTNHDATLGRGRTVTVRVTWEIYLRLLTRYWVP
jgi:hypothetical protein